MTDKTTEPGNTGFFVPKILVINAGKLSGIIFMIGSGCRWFERRQNKKDWAKKVDFFLADFARN